MEPNETLGSNCFWESYNLAYVQAIKGLIVRYIPADILNTALKNAAQHVDRVDRDIFVLAHTIKKTMTDFIIFDQFVLGHSLLLERIKKDIIYNHYENLRIYLSAARTKWNFDLIDISERKKFYNFIEIPIKFIKFKTEVYDESQNVIRNLNILYPEMFSKQIADIWAIYRVSASVAS